MEQRRFHRKLAAILAADIVGYSRLMEADESRTFNALMNLRHEFLDRAVTDYHGHLIKTTGDGFLAEFASAVDAVVCAVAIQQGVAARMRSVPRPDRLVFRIGVNIGDVLADGRDVFGDGVNLAARIEALCDPGGVCVSAGVREQLHGKLGLVLTDRGEQTVKNIARPVRVFSVAAEEAERFLLTPVPTAEPRRASGRKAVLAAAGLALVAVVAAAAWEAGGDAWPWRRDAPAGSLPAAPVVQASIAVLPFANLGGDADQDFFADGLVDNLTTDLSVAIADLVVIARSSAFAYKGRTIDVKQVGRELGVHYVLEGSVQRGGDQLRINAQLIDAASAAQVWADRFDGQRADLLAMQDQITARIANTLHVELVRAGARLAESGAQTSASDLVLRGEAALTRPYSRASFAEAEGYFRRALAIDQTSVAAMGDLGRVLALRADNFDGRATASLATELEEAKALLDRALAIEPRRPGLHNALGLVYRGLDQQRDAAEQFKLEIAINKNAAGAYANLGSSLIYIGKPEEAIPLIEKSLLLNPRNPNIAIELSQLARAHFALKQYDVAIALWERARAANPDIAFVLYQLAAAYALAGSEAQAKAALAQALKVDPKLTIASIRANRKSREPAYLALFEQIYEGLRRAGLPEG